MKNNYLFCLLFAFFPLFLFAQEKGIGVNINILPRYKIETKADGSRYYKVDRYALRPSLYGYKMYRHGTRMKEFGLEFDSYKKTNQQFLSSYDTLAKKLIYTPYDVNTKIFAFQTSYTKYYRLASLQEQKLNFWLGVRGRFLIDFGSQTPLTNIGVPTQRTNAVVYLGIIPSVTYKINQKLTLDARWNQPSHLALGMRYSRYKSPVLPEYLQKNYSYISDIQLIAWEPSFQVGLKYALNTFEEPPIIPPPLRKPSNTYIGIGLASDLNFNDHYRKYESFGWYFNYDRLRFDPAINVF